MSRSFWIAVTLLVAIWLAGVHTRCMAQEKPEAANADPSKKPLSTAELRRAAEKELAKQDRDGDSRLTLAEFLADTSGDERRQKHQRFFEWDTDEDERLNVDELAGQGQGVQLSPTADFRRRDGNDDGQVSLQEFLACEAESTDPRAKGLFGVLDFDGSESLSRDEFLAWPDRLPIDKRPRVPDPLADARRAAFDSWKTLFASADRDGDGALNEREWPASKLAAVLPGIGDIAFAFWDREGDGRVDESDGGWLLDVAYGFIRPDGKPLRGKGGDVLSWGWLRGMDTNGDGRLSRDEFVPRFNLGQEKNEELFDDRDTDGDGQLDDEELGPIFAIDVLSQFLSLDVDFDSRLAHDELVKAFGNRIPNIVERILPAFDGDGDGRLSLYEFRMLPYTNPLTFWNAGRTDADHDGRLSWKEYYLEAPPLLIGLNRYFFDHFDLDKDGFLSLDEWDFNVDFGKVPPKVAIRLKDRNGDGKLQFAELFSEKQPDGGGKAVEAYRRRLAEAEDRFRGADADADRALAPNELVAWFQAGTKATAKAAQREPERPAMEHAKKVFADLDKNSDQELTRDEFLSDATGDIRGQKHRQFFTWDVDENQRLSLEEFLRRAEGARLSPTADFRRRDENGDGSLSLDEMLSGEDEKGRPNARRQFAVLDFDKSETLSADEFSAWPGRLPLAERPSVPDPLADLRRTAFDRWKALCLAADSDGNGVFTAREWPTKKIAAAIPALADLPFTEWDRNRDGRVEEAEGERIFDVAYGIARPDGKPLRGKGGDVLSWGWLRGLDANNDGRLSRDEFVSRFNLGKEKNKELFDARDTDGDGQLDDEELRPLFTIDVLSSFLNLDADFDGQLAHDELVKAFGGRIPNIVERLLPGFDGDGDGRLSLYEFRMVPYANPLTHWDVPRVDADRDGRLSWKEYYLEVPPLLIGLNRHFFDHFDLNKDGFLSLDEWDFNVDFTKVSPEVAIRIKDRNGDGKLQFAELFSEKQPDGVGNAVEAYRRRLAEAEDRFRGADRDADRALAPNELIAWFQAEAKAAQHEAERLAMEQTKKVFAELDKNGDRELARDEFLSDATGDIRDQKQRQFVAWDVDENQKLSLEEFLRKAESVRLSPTADFRLRDKNGDGSLSLDEMLSGEGEKGRPNARRQFAVLDFDKSETLSADEFSAWPGRLPLAERPSVPDPLTDLRRTAFDTWKALCLAADRDGDGVFTAREWPTKKIAAAVPALADLPFTEWDRNRDGRVEEAEGERIFDVAYGIARPDGKPLRGKGGDVLSWGWFRGLDANNDGRLSRDEFVSRFNLGKEKNRELFDARDTDRDGQLDDEEFRPLFTVDVLGSFLSLDANFDGQLAHDELVKAFGDRIPNIVERLLPGFDGDGDGRLSLYEFRMVPYANPLTHWDVRRLDTNHDGRLSWKEYYLEAPPLLIGLNRHFFDRFDLDKDGFLSLNEWDFDVDVAEVPPEVGFRVKDADGDGKLTFAEVFAEKKPADGDPRAMDRYEMRLAHAENRFLSDDKDGNGYFDLEEWLQSQQGAMDAARRHSKVLSDRKTMLEGNYWVRKGVLVVNEIAFIAGVWVIIRRQRLKGRRTDQSSTA